MILIFGGVYQGKLEYALKRFNISHDNVKYCLDNDTTVPTGKHIIYEIDKWILALVRANMNIAQHTVRFLAQNSNNAIIICNDISCGVVPIDPALRKWREEVGRFMASTAQHSNEVIRIFCGIPTILKGEM